MILSPQQQVDLPGLAAGELRNGREQGAEARVFPMWTILVPVAVEMCWFCAIAPRLWRNTSERANHAEGEEPLGQVASLGEVFLGLVWVFYHWPVLPIAWLLTVVRIRAWTQFWLTMLLMAITPVPYTVLLAWLSGALP